jgi:hypothetical protein
MNSQIVLGNIGNIDDRQVKFEDVRGGYVWLRPSEACVSPGDNDGETRIYARGDGRTFIAKGSILEVLAAFGCQTDPRKPVRPVGEAGANWAECLRCGRGAHRIRDIRHNKACRIHHRGSNAQDE